ncbi:MAG TPA: HRDC domain-containing protein [Acidimicrobiales bacterium]|nr:HRDC domain-containing protein [Acidimicrobiales bacterium]
MAVDARRAPAARQVISDPTALADLVAELVRADRYGLDTEFHRERSYFPHLALVQVAWPGGIALVDPLAVDVAPLAEVLAGPGLAVLHAADQDLEVLDRACGRVPSRLFDTQLAAGFIGFSSPSLSSLVERLLGQRLEKGDQLTDWTRRPLTPAQLRYAASDVAHLLELHDRIAAELDSTGRSAWAAEECALMLARARSAVLPEEAWWRLKHARQLRGPERGIAQCVAAWRERRAQALDLPVRFILSDLALLSITHRPPRTRSELEQVRSLDIRQLGGAAASELLEAVAAGRSLGSRLLRLPPSQGTSAPVRPAVTLAASWLAERAQALRIDPAILATRADLVAYLQERPEGRLVNTWRHGLIGEPLARLAAGELALAFGADGSLVLEERTYRRVELDASG